MLAGFGLVVAVPFTARLFALSFADRSDVVFALAMAGVGAVVMTFVRRLGCGRSAT
jgi:hypothetical protein